MECDAYNGGISAVLMQEGRSCKLLFKLCDIVSIISSACSLFFIMTMKFCSLLNKSTKEAELLALELGIVFLIKIF